MDSSKKRFAKPTFPILILFIAIPVLLASVNFIFDVSASQTLGQLSGNGSSPQIGSPPPPPIGTPTPLTNDDIANATIVESLPYTDTVDTTDATLEDGEPEYTCGLIVDNTVWYRYAPAADGIFVVDTIGSDFINVIHVFEDLGGGNLQLVGCDVYEGYNAPQLSVAGKTGTSYLIGIGGDQGRSGILTVNISEPDPFTSCTSVDVPQEECEALVNLYNNTGGVSWNNNTGWLAIDRVCAWYGVTCYGGSVELINLFSNNLVGTFDVDFSGFSSSLGIAVGDNQLNGDFAAILGNMPAELGALYIDSNNITGTIPDSISGFSNLAGFKAGGNPLTGDLSTIVDYLPPSLIEIYLDNTQISGTIPDSISKFPHIFDLNLSYNPNMSGVISMGITNVNISTFNFEGTNLCEPDDPAYDDWQATVYNYFPGPCNQGPPDLVIDGVSITPVNPQYGEIVTITVHARNAGEDLDDIFVSDLFIDRVPDVCNDSSNDQIFDRFSSGTSLDIEYQFDYLTPGPHEIYAYLDTLCSITESDEDNNSYGPISIYVSGTPPVVEILSPVDRSTFDFNVPIWLNGNAADSEDGDISHLITWSSNLDGVIGTGESITFYNATPGNHVITAEVTDSTNETAQATVRVMVFENVPPVPILFNPEFPEGAVGLWHKSVSLFGDKNGSSDFLTLQVHMDAGPGDPNGVNVQYLVDTNELYLQAADSENWIGPCTPGDVGTLSNGYVEINCKLTTPYYLADHFMKLRILARWIQPIEAPIEMDVLLRATDIYDNDSGFKSKGTWTLIPE